MALPVLFFYDTRFCSQCWHTNVGHGNMRTLFLSLILFLVPSDTILHWPNPNGLVATQSTWCFVDSAPHR